MEKNLGGNPVAKKEGAARRQEIVKFVRGYDAQYSMPPSIDEIAQSVGCSSKRVRYHLDILEAEGKILREVGIPRSVRAL